jgi:hypothetical protein
MSDPGPPGIPMRILSRARIPLGAALLAAIFVAWRDHDRSTLTRALATDSLTWDGAGHVRANLQLLSAFAAFTLNGIFLGTVWFAAARRLEAARLVAGAWTPLLASAAVAVLGYLAFWAYFAGPTFGRMFTLGVFVLGGLDLLRDRGANTGLGEDAVAASKLLILVGVLYLAVLYLFSSDLDFYELAIGRWRTMSHDNAMPHAVAEDLYLGKSLHWPPAGWLSSDRPPLQSGWMLLTWVFGSALRLDDRAMGATSAMWLQLTWVFALYGLLASLGLPRRRACAWIAVLSLCGFFVFNSAFTWPKLSAGAFGCGAFGLWALPNRDAVSRSGIIIGGVLAALALLSHAGVAFSFVALAPWVITRVPARGRAWGEAFLLFLLLMLPWTAYQKFYEPPGNRLLKMHLAGQIDVDNRSTWEAVRDSYSKLSWAEIIAVRKANLAMQVPRDWQWLHDFSSAGAPRRRGMEIFILPNALTWWIFGLGAFPLAFIRLRGRLDWTPHLTLLAWVLATLALWCSLLYFPTMAIVHQGSYCVPMVLFALLTTWLERASAWAIAGILVLQSATFLSTWAAAGDQGSGPANPTAVAFAAIAGVLMAASVALQFKARPQAKT